MQSNSCLTGHHVNKLPAIIPSPSSYAPLHILSPTSTSCPPPPAGYPPVEAVKAAPAKAQEEAGAKKQSAAAALGESMKEVVGSWRTWLLAVTYFFVYLIRQGCTSWLVFYLLEVKGAADAAAAALTVSGGCLGSWFGQWGYRGGGRRS